MNSLLWVAAFVGLAAVVPTLWGFFVLGPMNARHAHHMAVSDVQNWVTATSTARCPFCAEHGWVSEVAVSRYIGPGSSRVGKSYFCSRYHEWDDEEEA